MSPMLPPRSASPRERSSCRGASPRGRASPPSSTRSARNKIPRPQVVWREDQSLASIREAIRSELSDFLVCERFQAALQDRVALAFRGAGCASQSGVLERVEAMLERLENTQRSRGGPAGAEVTFGSLADMRSSELSGNEYDSGAHSVQLPTEDENRYEDDDDDDDDADADRKNFDEKVHHASNHSVEVDVAVDEEDEGPLHHMKQRYYIWWHRLQEPPRTGCLAEAIRGQTLELLMCLVVVLDIALMIYEADRAVSQLEGPCDYCKIVNVTFQVAYTLELALKLAVHGRWFFCNDDMRQNLFDFFLVVFGFIDFILVESGAGGRAIRVLRLARLAKALRALKVISRIKYLHVFVSCLHGCISAFFWALVMLTIFFVMFSLFFVKLLASSLESSMSMSDDMEAMFGSVQQSMLTLFMATSGGEDWAVAYRVIGDVGPVGSLCYLLFVAFVQLCLVNIITGIFVDAAMQTLAPSAETVARSHAEQEADYAKELQRLCTLVDDDQSGKLTPEQFEEGMHRGRIPMLLTMLGLRKDHVLNLFQEMSELHKDDGGQVDIGKFVACCMQLRGPATHYDLLRVMSKLETMQHSQSQVKKMTRKLTFSQPLGRRSLQVS